MLAEETVLGGSAARVRRIGRWCVAVGAAVSVAVLGVWLFLPLPSVRRALVLVALACGVACLVVLARQRDSAAAVREAFGVPADDEPAPTRCTPAPDPVATSASTCPPPLPRALPSRRPQQIRILARGLGLTAGLLALVALAAGRPEPSAQVARLGAAGGLFAEVRILEVGESDFHDPSRGSSYYTADVVVELHGAEGDGRGATTVRARSDGPPRPGDRTTVL
ncbi:hypothetical protein [Streptomyces luteolus]|uniref:Integral membrane protein n=1 Tax=Streptomyces luteolus TaxID=3043615 RepID=A0ABT6SYT7_9ACTN|nr:hypothetical protein [Streptomyces sp. B-S-A12]MDI3420761.1 hypothetical protein [Streptomyces sp. B-S-A12]